MFVSTKFCILGQSTNISTLVHAKNSHLKGTYIIIVYQLQCIMWSITLCCGLVKLRDPDTIWHAWHEAWFCTSLLVGNGHHYSCMLICVYRQGHTAVVSFLLQEAQCNPNRGTHDGRTPLELTHKPEILRLLLHFGAKPPGLHFSCYPRGTPTNRTITVLALSNLNISIDAGSMSTIVRAFGNGGQALFHVLNQFTDVGEKTSSFIHVTDLWHSRLYRLASQSCNEGCRSFSYNTPFTLGLTGPLTTGTLALHRTCSTPSGICIRHWMDSIRRKQIPMKLVHFGVFVDRNPLEPITGNY